jgi:hypothetical protein
MDQDHSQSINPHLIWILDISVIDARLSKGLEREVVLIRESEFSRGDFVGGLGWDDYCNNMDTGKRKKMVQVQDDDKGNLGESGGGQNEEKDTGSK